VLEKGLTDAEVSRAERRYGIRFAQDHRELLSVALPVGDCWFDWRANDDERVRHALRQPLEGILFDVENNEFWPASWGERPESAAARYEIVEQRARSWPELIPLYAHRYLPAAPYGPGAPIFSVHQTDVIIYGWDLADYTAKEFGVVRERDHRPMPEGLEPWTLLAYGLEVP
jgi:hypothetical protein